MPHLQVLGEGKVVWLTGASGGLGTGIARRLAQAGFHLGLHAGTNRDHLRKLAGSLSKNGAQVAVTSGDLSNPNVAEQSFQAVSELLGAPWGVVHLAGPYAHGEIISHTSEQFSTMLRGNLTSLFEVMKVSVPSMRQSGGGRIVATAMAGAHLTYPMRHNGPHLAAKSGVVALTRTLALEEAPNGITANVISPGNINRKELDREQARNTPSGPSHPMGFHGSYDDLADAILFLLSEGAGYITGSVIEVTGGWTTEDFHPHSHD